MLLESPNPFETKSNKRSSVRSLLDLKMSGKSGKSGKEAKQPSSLANSGNLHVKANESSHKD